MSKRSDRRRAMQEAEAAKILAEPRPGLPISPEEADALIAKNGQLLGEYRELIARAEQTGRKVWQLEAMAHEKGHFFLGLPDRWYESPTWRCEKGHISKRFLKSEELGDLCLACQTRVFLTFPEDAEAVLP